MSKTTKASAAHELPRLTGQELTEDLYVTDHYGAFNTARIRGHSASSTSSAKEAAERLADKLFGPSLRNVSEVDPGRNTYVRLFRATADPLAVAWVWANGMVHVGAEAPEGALEVAAGPERALKERLAVVMREGQGASKRCLLLPGIPEATSQREGCDALEAFLVWAALFTNANRDNCGVRFYPYLPDRLDKLQQRVNERREKCGMALITSPALKGALERGHQHARRAA
jgi:hypothetical protein